MTLGSLFGSLGDVKQAEAERLTELERLVEEVEALQIQVGHLEEEVEQATYRVTQLEEIVQENEAITQRAIYDLRSKVDLLAKEAGVSFILKGPTEEHWEVEDEAARRAARRLVGANHLEQLAHELEVEEYRAAKSSKKK